VPADLDLDHDADLERFAVAVSRGAAPSGVITVAGIRVRVTPADLASSNAGTA
jgi:hypothetical protein